MINSAVKYQDQEKAVRVLSLYRKRMDQFVLVAFDRLDIQWSQKELTELFRKFDETELPQDFYTSKHKEGVGRAAKWKLWG